MVCKYLDRRRFVGLLAATTTAGLAGCNGGQDGDSEEDDVGEEPTGEDGAEGSGEESFVRVVHAVPDGPEVDVTVDEEPLLEGVAFRTVSEYLPLSAGTHDVRIETAGGEGAAGGEGTAGDEAETEAETDGDTGAEEDATETEADAGGDAAEADGGDGAEAEGDGGTETEAVGGDGGALFEQEVEVPSDTSITLVALGELSAETVEVRTFEDMTTGTEEQATPAEDTATPGETLTTGDETPGVDATPVTETTAGGETPAEETAGGEQMTGTAETEAGTDDARLRLLHASPDAPNVDVALEGEDDPLLSDVGFADASDYESLAAETQTLNVRAAGETDTLATSEVEIESQTPYTAFAMGYLRGEDAETDAPFDLTLATDTSGTTDGTDGDSGEAGAEGEEATDREETTEPTGPEENTADEEGAAEAD